MSVLKTSFLRMVEHSEDHRIIVNHKELKELLVNLPPQPDILEATPPKDRLKDVATNDSAPEQSPKPPKRRHFKKKDKQSRKQNLGEVQAEETEGKLETSQFNPLAVVSRSEEFKKEFLRRLPFLFQEGEDVLVISLGYSSIDCPGMLSEEKVK